MPRAPIGPIPRRLDAESNSLSRDARSESGLEDPTGVSKAASFANFMQRSAVPPIPTPMIAGGQILPAKQESRTHWITNFFTPSKPSAGNIIR